MENNKQIESQNERPKSEMEKKFDGLSDTRKAGVLIAFLGLVFGMILTLDLIGFTLDDYGTGKPMFPFSNQTIWIINICIGMVGGLLCAPKKMLAASISGVILGASITGLTVLYTSWRSSLIVYELLIPFFVSLVLSYKIYGFIAGESSKLSNDEFSIWTGPKKPK